MSFNVLGVLVQRLEQAFRLPLAPLRLSTRLLGRVSFVCRIHRHRRQHHGRAIRLVQRLDGSAIKLVQIEAVDLLVVVYFRLVLLHQLRLVVARVLRVLCVFAGVGELLAAVDRDGV